MSEMRAPRADRPSQLEIRYRRLLRVLPTAYRAVRGDEMVEAFLRREVDTSPELEDLTLRMGWPSPREAASVVALALRLRWADPRAPERYRVRTAGLRFGTFACLTVLALVAAQELVGDVWFLLAPPSDLAAASPVRILFGGAHGGWALVRDWAFALWIPALILAVTGVRRTVEKRPTAGEHRTGRAGRVVGEHRALGWAARLGAVPAAVTVITGVARSFDAAPFGAQDLGMVVVQLATVAGLVWLAMSPAARDDASAPQGPGTWRRGWPVPVGVAFVVWEVGLVAAWRLPLPALRSAVGYAVMDGVGPWCVATVVVAVALLVRRAGGRRPGTAALLGLAWLGAASTVLRAATIPLWLQVADGARQGSFLVAALVQLALVAVIALVAALLAGRGVRRLPAIRYQPTGVPA